MKKLFELYVVFDEDEDDLIGVYEDFVAEDTPLLRKELCEKAFEDFSYNAEDFINGEDDEIRIFPHNDRTQGIRVFTKEEKIKGLKNKLKEIKNEIKYIEDKFE